MGNNEHRLHVAIFASGILGAGLIAIIIGVAVMLLVTGP